MATKKAKSPIQSKRKNNNQILKMLQSRLGVGVLVFIAFAIVGSVFLALSKAEDPNTVSVKIIKTQFSYPSNAVFVSPSGSDASSTASQSAPLKTLKAAVSKASSGSTIVMRAGVYREELGTVEKALTIQAYPNEEVWLDGSEEVTGWTQEGAVWRKSGWTSANQICPNSDCFNPALVTADNPQAGLPDMLFIDGTPQKQVSELSKVVSGTFFVDRAGQKLYMGDNPSGKKVEASTKREAMFYRTERVAGSKLRGIGIRRYAGNVEFSDRSKPGQINATSGARGIEFDSVVFTQGAANGLFIAGLSSNYAPGISIKNSLFASNGASGVSATRIDGFTMDNNIFYNNSNEKPNSDGDDGSYAGSKLTYATNSSIRNNLFQDNFGTGFWCDLDCNKVTITGNMTRGNTLDGIFYEVSSNGIVASNVSSGNGRWGYKIGGRGIKVYNNTAYNNTLEGIYVYDDGRLTSQNIEVKNNIAASGARTKADRHLIYAQPSMSNVGTVMTGLDSNLYFRSNSVSPRYVLGWQGTNIDAHYTTLAAAKQQTGRESKGIIIEGKPIGAIFKDASSGNFQLVTGSEAVNSSEALPADVATAVGLSTGQIVSRGAVTWKNGASNSTASAAPDPVVVPTPPANSVPSTTLATSGVSFTAPASFQVTANATDTDGTVTKVEILQNGAVVHSCDAATCRYDASGYGTGSFQYTARAYDNVTPAGVGTSSVQTIAISAPATPPPAPVPPVVIPSLSAPTGLNIISGIRTDNYLPISWSPVVGAKSYIVTRAGMTPKTVTSNSFAEIVQPGLTYAYQVKAINGAVESPLSTPLKAKIGCFLWFCGPSVVQ